MLLAVCWQVYETQQLLERESRLLKGELAAFTQQLTTWSATTQQLLVALKHVGDLEHYVAVLSREAAALAKVLAAAQAEEAAGADASAAGGAGTSAADIITGTAVLEHNRVAHSTAGAAGALASGAASPAAGPQESSAAPELPVSKRASR